MALNLSTKTTVIAAVVSIAAVLSLAYLTKDFVFPKKEVVIADAVPEQVLPPLTPSLADPMRPVSGIKKWIPSKSTKKPEVKTTPAPTVVTPPAVQPEKDPPKSPVQPVISSPPPPEPKGVQEFESKLNLDSHFNRFEKKMQDFEKRMQ